MHAIRVELPQQGAGDLFYLPRLLRRKVLSPCAGRGFAAELALASVLLRDILEGVLLYGLLQLLLVHVDAQRIADIRYAISRVRPKVFVPDQDLRPVGVSGVS